MTQSVTGRPTTEGKRGGVAPAAGEEISRRPEVPLPYMRRPNKTEARGSTPLPDLFVIVANRLGYGPKPGQRQAWEALGGNDDARLQAWMDQQLNHGAIVDTAYDAIHNQFTTLDKTRNQLWREHAEASSGQSLPVQECERDRFVRAIYSEKLLLNVMVDFWLDHFSLFGWEYASRSVMPDWIRTLETHAFGNFRDFLGDVAEHTAMLYYLDQFASSAPFPNENYPRELFELHTFGEENYLGVMDPLLVPDDPDHPGYKLGYVDNDVYEAARCLAGWTYWDEDTAQGGLFRYRDDWHDIGTKLVLGEIINNGANTPQQDGYDLLDLIADHPATGRHLARKLCERFVSDDPPQTLIDSAASVWRDNRSQANQIELVMRHIVSSVEFKNSFGDKVKRPFQVVAGAMRSTDFVMDWVNDTDDISSLLGRMDGTGHGIFNWRPPDGAPDVRGYWEATAPRVMTWRFVLWLTDITDDNGTGLKRMNIAGITPANLRTATELADYWIDRILERPIAAVDRQEIIDFMAAGFNPDLDLDLANPSTEQRLRMMVGLILNSPDNLVR